MTTIRQTFIELYAYMNQKVIGQQHLNERLILALLANGHVLIEGLPGLAKTRAVKTMVTCLDISHKRIQCTPDLLPSDLTGSYIYHPKKGSFHFHPGPLFSNIILVDEVNRSSAKVQSALLESMAESQISIANETFILPHLFTVFATQNPLEQEGTHVLPEAQLDRFLFSVPVSYPNFDDEKKILQLSRIEQEHERSSKAPNIAQTTIFEARKEIASIHMSDAVENYIIRLISATRHPIQHDDEICSLLACGISTRATQSLDRAARSLAWLRGRDFVTPEDVRHVLGDVIRHRIKQTLSSEQHHSIENIISLLLNKVSIH